MENRLNQMKIEGTDNGRSLADPWELSEDVQNFDPTVLLSTIMIKGAQLEPLWSDPVFFYRMNAQWWKKWYSTFNSWCVALEKEYEPLWDRNGYEEIHEDTTDTGTVDTATSDSEIVDDDQTYNKSGTGSNQASGSDTSEHESSRDISVTNTVSAFDSSSYQPDSKSDTSDDLTKDDTTTTYGRKDTSSWSENGGATDDKTTTRSGTLDTDTSNDKDFDRSYHSWGNWGISQTSQKLLASELEVRYWNVYDHMADIYLDEMAVRVF